MGHSGSSHALKGETGYLFCGLQALLEGYSQTEDGHYSH